jgi:formyltetrahydrofolate deformylase
MHVNSPASKSAILLVDCPDRKGIVTAITEFISRNGGNILYLDQHVDTQCQVFFMRVEWDLHDFAIDDGDIGEQFEARVGKHFSMKWRLHFSYEVPRMALFVSQQPHCFYDILARYEAGEWHLPVDPGNKVEQERTQLELLQRRRIDFIVLARYMQILSNSFVAEYPERIINIHHSFLPAFPGARPYHSAHERGVKIIGATSHYATAELDAGPIIEQDVVRVSHEDSVEDMIRKGRDLEKVVLARAVWHHLHHNILVYGNRTVVFE